MDLLPTDVVDINTLVKNVTDVYKNIPVAEVNDHVVRLAVMTEDFYWHYHPNSDETFIVIEGTLLLDFENGTIELNKGQMLTVPKKVPHRTRPKGDRSVNLTIELTEMETVRVEKM